MNFPFYPEENGVREAGYFKEIEDTKANDICHVEIVRSHPEDVKT